jgi:hypothetical protein
MGAAARTRRDAWRRIPVALALFVGVVAVPALAAPGPALAAARTSVPTGVRAIDSVPGDACDVTGHVLDPGGKPVPDVPVRLVLVGRPELTTTTDASGAYRFGGFARYRGDYDPIGGLMGRQVYDPRKGPVSVLVALRDPAGRFVFRSSSHRLGGEEDTFGGGVTLRTEARVQTVDFPLTRQPTCVKDIRLGSSTGLAVAEPSDPRRWQNLVAMYARVRASFDYARTGLGFTPPPGRTVHIFPWCVDNWFPGVDCPRSRPQPDGKPPAGTPLAVYDDNRGRPLIAILPEVSDQQAGCEDDALMHEVGHAVLTAGFRQGALGERGRVPHGGYYRNASSNDSWLEGFANFFAVQVRKTLGRTAPDFVVCGQNGPASVDLETDLQAWDGNGSYEEYAVAGLLLDLVDGQQDYSSVRVADLTKLTVVSYPGTPRIVVGRVVRQAEDAIAVRLEFVDAGGRTVHTAAAWVDDRTGVFLFAVPDALRFASVRAVEFAGGLVPRDDDPLHERAADLWAGLLCAGKGTAASCAAEPRGIRTMAELYTALAERWPGDRDHDGVDDVAQVFIAHGFHEDPAGGQAYQAGARVGLTSHPAPGASGRTGPVTPRHLVGVTTAVPVRVVGAVRTIVQVSYPNGQEADSFGYEARPGPSGLISVVLPPSSAQASVSLLALADGRIPRVVATLDPARLWSDGTSPASRSPIVVRAELRPGQVDPTGATAPSSSSSSGSGSGVDASADTGTGTGTGTGPWAGTGAGSGSGPGGRGWPRGVLLVVGGVLVLAAALLVVSWLLLRRTAVLVAAVVVGLAGAVALVPGIPGATSAPDPDGGTPSVTRIVTTRGSTRTPPPEGSELAVGRVTASATLAPQTGAGGATVRYDAGLVADGDPTTAWCAPGDGTGQTLRIELVGPPLVEAVAILPGYDKVDSDGSDRWATNRRVTRVTYRAGDVAVTAVLNGRRTAQSATLAPNVAVREVEVRVDATTAGQDTCISEITIYGTPRGI